jgi:hypothetical protein
MQQQKWQKEGCLNPASDKIWIAAGFTYGMLIAKKADKAKHARTYKEVVLEYYQDFEKVFSEADLKCLLKHKLWGNKTDPIPKKLSEHWSKNYPMSVNKEQEVDKFLKENVCKEYIQLLQSPFAASIFFVKKKGEKLCFI